MDILTLIGSYGVLFVFAVIIIITESILKKRIKATWRPYAPLLLAIPLAIFSPLLVTPPPTTLIMWLKACLTDWVKIWVLAIIGYDLIVRLFQAQIQNLNETENNNDRIS